MSDTAPHTPVSSPTESASDISGGGGGGIRGPLSLPSLLNVIDYESETDKT